VLALAADLAAHAWLSGVWLYGAPLNNATALDAVVDAALARRLSFVKLTACYLPPASAPALARLLGGNTLAALNVYGHFRQLLMRLPRRCWPTRCAQTRHSQRYH
jgi:hypothetical protein